MYTGIRPTVAILLRRFPLDLISGSLELRLSSFARKLIIVDVSANLLNFLLADCVREPEILAGLFPLVAYMPIRFKIKLTHRNKSTKDKTN